MQEKIGVDAIEEIEVDVKEQPNRMVPLKALEEERKKYKAKLQDPLVVRGKEIVQKLQDMLGVEVDDISAALDELQNEGETSGQEIKQEIKEDYLTELAELVQNPNYADSAQYINELKEYAKENNCNLKTAYNALFAEQKYEEIRIKAEQEAVNNMLSKQSRKIDAVNGGNGNSGLKKRLKLDKDQLSMAAAYGMTPEEYAKYM